MTRPGVRVALLLAGLLVPILAAAQSSTAARPDFSGRWVLQLHRSQLAEPFRDLTKGVVRIVHNEPSFFFRRAFTRSGTLSTLSFSLRTDGGVIHGRESGMPTSQSLSWAGDSLVFITVYQTPRGEARNTVHYSLEDGGMTFRAQESFRVPRLSYDNLWVFAKAD